MPKNKGKGGKNRRRGKKEDEEKRELVFKEDGQEYGQVMRMLGNGRLEAFCFDGSKRLCHIRGKLRKKVWVNQGDIILVGLRDYQDGKCDVIMKYTADEARTLKAYGELPETARINVDFHDNDDDGVQVDFDTAAGEASGSDASGSDEDDGDSDASDEPPARGGSKPSAKPAAPAAGKAAPTTGAGAAGSKGPAKAAAKPKPAVQLYDPLKPNPNKKSVAVTEDSDED